jgi:hypothetical protein
MDEELKEKIAELLENEENASIIKLTHSKIKDTKNNMLQKLQLDKDTLKLFHTKLNNYRYVDELLNIRMGYYIRWINLKKTNDIKLTNGGIICDIKIIDDKVQIVCKNNMNRFMQIKLDECLIFQSISDQENILLSVMEYIVK